MDYLIEECDGEDEVRAKKFFYEVLLELDKYVCSKTGNRIVELHLMGYTHEEIAAMVNQKVHKVRSEIACFIEKTEKIFNEV